MSTIRHEPMDDCDGRPAIVLASTIAPGDVARKYVPARCHECQAYLCPCEISSGHDCEAGTDPVDIARRVIASPVFADLPNVRANLQRLIDADEDVTA